MISMMKRSIDRCWIVTLVLLPTLASACAIEVGDVPPSDDEDKTQLCGTPGLASCPETHYCDIADNTCDEDIEPGLCQPRPDFCPEYYSPTCACNGVVYDNECFAAAAGVDVSEVDTCGLQGEGETCGGTSGLFCATGLTCDFTDSTCGPDATGVCRHPVEILCAEEHAPVCGCDGVTYESDCLRQAAHVALDYPGACDGEPGEMGAPCGGIAGLTCRDALVCDFSALDFSDAGGVCESDLMGVCVQDPGPIMCTLQYDPQCSCSGTTYGNLCQLRADFEARAHEGTCEEGP